MHTNPFRYGDLALGDAFADRERELAELRSDLRNGQNVVVFAPRRYGKSSLVRMAAAELVESGELALALVDLLAAPSKEKLAEKLAQAVYDGIASRLVRVRERAIEVFGGLRVTPRVTVDPVSGQFSFSFEASRRGEDIDATLERLLELPGLLAAQRGVRAALVLDEFQEITDIDPDLPALMRSVFQNQPEVAHVYLGSKRSMMERLFADEDTAFWRSAKKMELGPIPAHPFAEFIGAHFTASGRETEPHAIERLLSITACHPYGSQELAYFLWEETPERSRAGDAELESALERALRSEHAHFSRIWENAARSHRLVLQALAREPSKPIGEAYRLRNGLPSDATVRKALRVLAADELVARSDQGGYRISEPFLAEWIARFES
jgi:hypothetical protein